MPNFLAKIKMDDSSLNVELELEFLVYQSQDFKKGSKNESDEDQVGTTEKLQMMQIPVKGQLISKYPFGVIVLTKIPTDFLKDFCPSL